MPIWVWILIGFLVALGLYRLWLYLINLRASLLKAVREAWKED